MKRWTEEEEKKLIRLSNKYTQSDIAKKMNRSVRSIHEKLLSLNINGMLTDRCDDWTFTQITEMLGLGPRVVNTTFVKHGLKFQKRGRYCFVKEEDLIHFMKNNPNLWDATKVEYYIFSEYNWFLKKLEEDKKKSKSISKEYHWTDYEKQRFSILKRRGFTHEQIAKELGRSKKAVDAYSMSHKNIVDRHHWSETQIQQIISLKEQGYTHEEISKVIGRTKSSVDNYCHKHKNLLERKE